MLEESSPSAASRAAWACPSRSDAVSYRPEDYPRTCLPAAYSAAHPEARLPKAVAHDATQHPECTRSRVELPSERVTVRGTLQRGSCVPMSCT